MPQSLAQHGTLFWYNTLGMPILATIRSTLLLAFRYLPLLLISFIGFLGLGLGNMSLFMLFIGQAGVVPAITEFLHLLTNKNYSLMSMNDISQLVPIKPSSGDSYATTANIYPSYWMAHISFFFGYLIMNAITILTTETDLSIIKSATSKDALGAKIQSRKDKASMLIGNLFFFYILISITRYYATGAEQVWGMLLALLLFGVGLGWYKIAELCGATNSDIFGIAMQMMSVDTAQDKPKACVYTAKN